MEIPAQKWGDTEIAERGRSVLVMCARYRPTTKFGWRVFSCKSCPLMYLKRPWVLPFAKSQLGLQLTLLS